jgi:predicted transcriptional regulator
MSNVTKVRDLMVPIADYPSVRDTATLREAIEVIENARLEVKLRKSLPRVLLVYDAIDLMVGYVRRRDIMRGLEPEHLLTKPLDYSKKPFDIAVDFNLAELSFATVAKAVRKQAERSVRDVMQPNETTVDADDHVMKVVQEMVALDVPLIPVLDSGKLVGVVRSVDVLQELARMLE